ncbi:NAD(P)-binding protein [Amylocystis lapponica]|nr:NAD(P)-binding protein [Amylocystis lapponica]
MAIPTTTREYRLPKADGFKSLVIQNASVRPPKSSEVLLKVHAVSLQYRDLMVAKNQYPLGQKENPVVCSDMAGEIVALGDDVKGWSIGDRVSPNFALDHLYGPATHALMRSALGAATDGVLTEYKLVPAHSLVRAPAHLSYEEAATLPCAALTAYNALFGPVPLKGGDTVLVQGTGGVSVFALQFAAASGATVIATSSSDAKLSIAAKLGATHLINYKKTPNWDEEVLRITNGRGVDHVVEVGGMGTLAKSVAAVGCGGWIHVVGFVAGHGDVSNVPLGLLGKSAHLRGILVGPVVLFEQMNRLIAAQAIRPVVDRVFAFEDAVAAYEHLESQKHVGKVVIKVSKD